MDSSSRIVLSESEYRLLKALHDNKVQAAPLDELPRYTGIDKSSIASLVELLRSKGIVEVKEERTTRYQLTEKGYKALEEGLPEERLLRLLRDEGLRVDEAKKLLGPEAGVAIGIARRNKWIDVSGGVIKPLLSPGKALEEAARLRRTLERIREEGTADPGLLSILVKRGLLKPVEELRKNIIVRQDLSRVLSNASVEKGSLTHRDLKTGRWRSIVLRQYDVSAEPPRLRVARRHFLSEFLDMLRDLMKELGFTEAEGPLVELELYNFDLLFQAQDHPAREVHDTLWIKDPSHGSLEGLEDLVERVSRIHSKGWGYKWSPVKSSRHVLRSQTTSVSARIISSRPKPPIRFFSLGRVFRSDVVDASHLPEFHQLDGIMGDHGIGFSDLLGLLTEVSERLGFKIKFKPGYFPFTEPSVEGYVKLPNGRWLELFGAGMFRPEVLEMAGIDYPVAAWGFGVERLAAAYYGITDIRRLYTRDVDYISDFPLARWL